MPAAKKADTAYVLMMLGAPAASLAYRVSTAKPAMTMPATILLAQLRIPCRSANMTPSTAKGAANSAQYCVPAKAKRQRSTIASLENATGTFLAAGEKANRVM